MRYWGFQSTLCHEMMIGGLSINYRNKWLFKIN
jgi:hypothetical protein